MPWFRGELPSPQHCGEFTLFALRFRDRPSPARRWGNRHAATGYLARPEMIDRVGGVPVVFEHPAGALDTAEFTRRAIGVACSAIRPIATGIANANGPDLWCIARVQDADAAKFMVEHETSTSPGVGFSKDDGNTVHPINPDEHLLIEGDPSRLSHLAICPSGVWDKFGNGDGTVGVRNDEHKDTEMADLEETKTLPLLGPKTLECDAGLGGAADEDTAPASADLIDHGKIPQGQAKDMFQARKKRDAARRTPRPSLPRVQRKQWLAAANRSRPSPTAGTTP